MTVSGGRCYDGRSGGQASKAETKTTGLGKRLIRTDTCSFYAVHGSNAVHYVLSYLSMSERKDEDGQE